MPVRSLLVVALLACGGGSDGPSSPGEPAPTPRGALEILTMTSGSDADPDGYTLTISGVGIAHLGPVDTLLLRSIPEGEYSVGIVDVWPACEVGGGNPRGLRVRPGETTRAIFVVKCGEGAPGPTS